MSCSCVPRAPHGARVPHPANRVGPRQLVHSVPHRAPTDDMDHVGGTGVASSPSASDERRPAAAPACATTRRHARGQQPDQRARHAWVGAVPRDAHPTRPRAHRGRSAAHLPTPGRRTARPPTPPASSKPLLSLTRTCGGLDLACVLLLTQSCCPSKTSTVLACSSVTKRVWPPSSCPSCPSPTEQSHCRRPSESGPRSAREG